MRFNRADNPDSKKQIVEANQNLVNHKLEIEEHKKTIEDLKNAHLSELENLQKEKNDLMNKNNKKLKIYKIILGVSLLINIGLTIYLNN